MAFTADGFTHRELRDYVEDVRSRLTASPRRRKDRDARGPGREDIRRVLDGAARRARDRPLGADRRPAGAECRQPGRHHPDRQRETDCCASPAHSNPKQDSCANINFVANGRLIRLRDIAAIRRGFADPPQPMFRVNGKPAIGLAIAMREGGDILALGRNIEQAMRRDHRRSAARHRADPGRRPASCGRACDSAISPRRCGRRSPSSWR